jgi:predicted metal-dependent phosphoesterase TrpH
MVRKGFKGDISEIRKKIDALECFNARNLFPGRNAFAELQAKKYNLAVTCGSDAHCIPEIGRAFTLFDSALSLSEAIKQRKTSFSGSYWYAPYGAVMSVFSKLRRGFL